MRNPPGEDATKGTGEGGGGEEEGDAVVLFFALVPHGEIEDYAREETGFGDAEEEAGNEEAGEGFGYAHEGCNDAPQESESGEPEAGGGAFEDNWVV